MWPAAELTGRGGCRVRVALGSNGRKNVVGQPWR